MHERTPERKELKGNDPTNPMYATCFSHTKQHDGKSPKAVVAKTIEDKSRKLNNNI
jgi:hypothetical protein